MSKHRAQITWPWRIPHWLPALLPHLLDINKEDAAESKQASTVLRVFVILYGPCIFVIPYAATAVRIASVPRWIHEYRVCGLCTIITSAPHKQLTLPPRYFRQCAIGLWNCLQSKNYYVPSIGGESELELFFYCVTCQLFFHLWGTDVDVLSSPSLQ